jgi:hypothetical protein
VTSDPSPNRVRWTLAVAAAAVFGLATWRAAGSVEPDYALHAEWAREISETGHVSVPHPLFHFLTVLVHALLPSRLAGLVRPGPDAAPADPSFLLAAMIVGTGAWVALALLVHHRLRVADGGGEEHAGPGPAGGRAPWAAAGLALSLLLLGPITVLTWAKHQLYLGYITPAVFHNPTVALVKPLALAWFWSVARARPGGKTNALGAALLTVAATLAKPSFTVAFLPALALWLVLGWRSQRAVDVRAGVASLVTGGLVVAAQAWLRRGSGDASLLVIAPLEVMGFYSPRWEMPLLFVLSVAFPLAAAFALRRVARRNGPLQLAWLTFAVAAGYGYVLAEADPNTGSGNWLWSGQIALFVLLAETLLLLRSRAEGASPRARRLVWLAFGLQLACGLLWYTAEVVQPHEWWFPFPEGD